jgi:DNA-binding MarR family transcriptional regulator
MNAEAEIEYTDNRLRVIVNIYHTYLWLNERYEHSLEKFDVTVNQFIVLRILRSFLPDSASLQMIKEKMMERNPDVSRIVNRLIAKGLVKRTPNELNRRKVDITLTDKGYELTEKVKIPPFQKLIFKLSDTEVAQLNQLLEKIREE